MGMRGRPIVAALLFTAQVLALGSRAQDAAEQAPAATRSGSVNPPASPTAAPPLATEPRAAPAVTPALTADSAAPVDAVVAAIRLNLADPGLAKDANPDDLAALVAFYGKRTGGPLWMTEMGLSEKGQSALFEIEKADDWGLAAAAFELPPAGELPASPRAQATAEIKLDLAILKYARFARGGRLNPSELSDLFDQAPPVHDPKTVLSEIAATESPNAYLQSLHPKHEQFQRLREALLKARGSGHAGGKPSGIAVEIERIITNMERWRWMPEDLGTLYVWNNVPEFMLYVVKDGKTIYADKTLVGAIGYATPVFSADMETIVFNPDWIAPETVLVENLLPPLRKKDYSILRNNNLKVSYNGNPVDVRKVDWRRVDIHNYTFTQAAGPKNVLGKVKFLFPNKHVVYMHDTLPVRRKFFQQSVRAIGHNCVRMEKPQQFAEVLLAEDKGWPASQVKDLWDKSVNSPVTLDHKIPVHMAYFTAVVDGTGKVATFADLYGLDNKLATALFGNATGFPPPPPESPGPQAEEADGSTLVKRTSARIAGWLRGFAGD
jgi:murein L,D-transpeptidase YcbB/YkuD